MENAFVADNDMSLNDKLGLYVGGAYNVVQNNKINCNGDDGLFLGILSFRNLIYQNKIECNVPEDIVNTGTDNNFYRNQTGCNHYWYRDGFDNRDTNKSNDAVDYKGQVMDSIRRRAELEQEVIAKLESGLEAVPDNLRNNQMIVVEHLKGELCQAGSNSIRIISDDRCYRPPQAYPKSLLFGSFEAGNIEQAG